MALPRLHPADPLERARQRGWMEFGSGVLNTIAAFYNATDEAALPAARATLQARLAQLEAACHAQGPWFAGASFGMVDAVFAPVFRYFDSFDAIFDHGVFRGTPKVLRWRAALAQRPSVKNAVVPDYRARLDRFIVKQNGALAAMMKATAA